MPDHIKEKARELARQELQRRLEELNMSVSEAKGYGALLEAVQGHIAQLFDLLERKYHYLIFVHKGSLDAQIFPRRRRNASG